MDVRVQVAIIGAGPSGLLLGRLLSLADIDFIILERQARAYVESRIRAGVLEPGTVRLLESAQVAGRLHDQALHHDGFDISISGQRRRVDLKGLTGFGVTVYGQTEITKDLYVAHDKAESNIVFEANDVVLERPDSDSPIVQYQKNGKRHRVRCDFVAGCDGFHGASRATVERALTCYEREYPFAWLGVLSATPPVSKELIYNQSERGFALCSMRSESLSRYYIQCRADENAESWPDDEFWDELRRRLPADAAETLKTGRAIEKTVAPLRSFVVEPMQLGQLFLVGDAAHIVPPTGAKGLNLALADASLLASALIIWYENKDRNLLNTYSETCLKRVWRAERFSWWFTIATHRFDDDPFSHKIQMAELDYLTNSTAGLTTIAENYVGVLD